MCVDIIEIHCKLRQIRFFFSTVSKLCHDNHDDDNDDDDDEGA